MTRFDARFDDEGCKPGAEAHAWEKKHHYLPNESDWAGHCDGGALASLIFEQPKLPSPNPQSLTQEDLELYATEYVMRLYRVKTLWELPGSYTSAAHRAIPHRSTPCPDLDKVAGIFYGVLARAIRTNKDACFMDLRTPASNPNDTDEVRAIWHHMVYKFRADYMEHPSSGDNEKDICVKCTLTANADDLTPNNKDPERGKKVVKRAQFRFIFNIAGAIVTDHARQRWESFEGYDALAGWNPQFVPRYICTFIDFSRPNSGGNQEIRWQQLRELGLKLRKKYRKLHLPS